MPRFFIPGRRIETGPAPYGLWCPHQGVKRGGSVGKVVNDFVRKKIRVDTVIGEPGVEIPPPAPRSPQTVAVPPLMPGGQSVSLADGYAARLVKNIPAENVGLYIFIRGLFPLQASTTQWILFAIGFVLVPVYMSVAARSEHKPALTSQLLLATLAFGVWVIAIGGPPFQSLSFYDPRWAEVILAVTTALFGAYKPTLGS